MHNLDAYGIIYIVSFAIIDIFFAYLTGPSALFRPIMVGRLVIEPPQFA